MKALQKRHPDESFWTNVYNYPMPDEDAKKELNQQRKWAREDKSKWKFRLVDVRLAM
jgi:hypothetical protein